MVISDVMCQIIFHFPLLFVGVTDCGLLTIYLVPTLFSLELANSVPLPEYIRGLFKKYRTFGRQKYNYLFGCLKP